MTPRWQAVGQMEYGYVSWFWALPHINLEKLDPRKIPLKSKFELGKSPQYVHFLGAPQKSLGASSVASLSVLANFELTEADRCPTEMLVESE